MKKNKNTSILVIFLIALLIVAYKVMFTTPYDGTLSSDFSESQVVISTLSKLQMVNLNTAVVNDPKFGTLKSIQTPLPNIPVGKENPFSQR